VCTDIIFSRVLITGAGPANPSDFGSGALVRFSGPIQQPGLPLDPNCCYIDSEIDNVLFTRCEIRQYDLTGGGSTATYCVFNDNVQALQISFEHCVLRTNESDPDTKVLVNSYVALIRGGACHFRHCDVGRASKAVFSLEAVHNTIIDDCYVEETNWRRDGPPAPFLEMENDVGVSRPNPIVVRNCELNTTTALLVLNCKQPVILEGNLFKANVYISQAPEYPPPTPPYTYSPVVSIANSFDFEIPGIGFTGGVPGGPPLPIPAGMLIKIADV
jgi:hypothetical protein